MLEDLAPERQAKLAKVREAWAGTFNRRAELGDRCARGSRPKDAEPFTTGARSFGADPFAIETRASRDHSAGIGWLLWAPRPTRNGHCVDRDGGALLWCRALDDR